jgi:hypothetical protein
VGYERQGEIIRNLALYPKKNMEKEIYQIAEAVVKKINDEKAN